MEMNMQSNQTKHFSICSGLVLCIFLLAASFSESAAQDKPVRVFLYLDYFQENDVSYLQAEMKYREEGMFYQISGQEVAFRQITDEGRLLLGTEMTGADGIARLGLDESIAWDSSGIAAFESEYAGSDRFRKAKKGLDVLKTTLVMEPEVIDSAYRLTVWGYELQGDKKVAIDGEDIHVLVERLYGDLPVQEGTFDAGAFGFEFPKHIPGDASGDLRVIARIREHDDYGNVEVNQKVRWGDSVSDIVQERPRALWGRAPVWIMAGLWGVLIFAWFHYALAVSSLFGMKEA